MIELSKVSPDFDSLRIQLEQATEGFSSWKDRFTSGTGQTIIEMIAAVGAYSQYSIESSYQETFSVSAKNAASQYANAIMSGVRIARFGPASLTVPLKTASGMVTIPAYSKFDGAGNAWFNRTAIQLTTTPTDVVLYQGEVITKDFVGNGTDFQAWVSEETGFVVADMDLIVKVNGTVIDSGTAGLWTKPGIPGSQQFTLKDGKAIVLFGNTLYGSRPGTNDYVNITYVITKGANGNNLITTGKTFSLSSDPSINGKPAGNPTGGGNQTDHNVFRTITPSLFGSFDAGVTAPQYKALPLQYPGVIDALVLSQREINPKALSWMNAAKVTLLTTSPWDQSQWLDFKAWYESKTMYSMEFYREDPVAVPVNLSCVVNCKNFAQLDDVRVDVEAAIQSFFAPKAGTIGKNIYLDDLYATIRTANANVEFVQIQDPVDDLILSGLTVPYPTLSRVLGSSTLVTDEIYDYAIGATSTLGGSIAPANWSSFLLDLDGRIKIDWTAVPNVTEYTVWGRSPGLYGLLATVPADTLTWTDTGAVDPTGTVPSQSTIESYYPTLGTLNVVMQYTSRSSRV